MTSPDRETTKAAFRAWLDVVVPLIPPEVRDIHLEWSLGIRDGRVIASAELFGFTVDNPLDREAGAAGDADWIAEDEAMEDDDELTEDQEAALMGWSGVDVTVLVEAGTAELWIESVFREGASMSPALRARLADPETSLSWADRADGELSFL